jgi:hypothetical protein
MAIQRETSRAGSPAQSHLPPKPRINCPASLTCTHLLYQLLGMSIQPIHTDMPRHTLPTCAGHADIDSQGHLAMWET